MACAWFAFLFIYRHTGDNSWGFDAINNSFRCDHAALYIAGFRVGYLNTAVAICDGLCLIAQAVFAGLFLRDVHEFRFYAVCDGGRIAFFGSNFLNDATVYRVDRAHAFKGFCLKFRNTRLFFLFDQRIQVTRRINSIARARGLSARSYALRYAVLLRIIYRFPYGASERYGQVAYGISYFKVGDDVGASRLAFHVRRHSPAVAKIRNYVNLSGKLSLTLISASRQSAAPFYTRGTDHGHEDRVGQIASDRRPFPSFRFFEVARQGN